MPDFSIAVLDPQAQNPAGGTTGQVNIKRSDRDYDYGWGSLNEAMKGDATAIGETVANMVFPSGSAANAQGNWTLFGSPEGYEADNSDDGTPNLLRVPFAFPDDADGLWLTTTRDGEQARTFFGLNRYAAAEEIPIRAAGESLEIRYHNEFDGEKPTISAKVLKGPLGESTTLSVALAVATPAIGLSQSDLDAVNRNIAAINQRLDNLPTTGQTIHLPARATMQELSALSLQALRSYTPSDLETAIEGKTTGITALAYNGTNRTLSLTFTRNGTSHTLTAGPWPAPATGPASAPHDFQQIADATALAAADTSETILITSAFTAGTVSWMVGDIGVHNGTAWIRIGSISPELTAGSVTTSILADNAVTEPKLGADVRTLLAGKLNTADLSTQITAAVEPPARTGNTTRWGENKLPVKLDDFLDALSGGSWADSTTSRVSSPPVTSANPANPESFTFVTTWSGPRYTNVWLLLRLPENDSIGLKRVAIGDVASAADDPQLLPSSSWTEIEHDGGYKYYTVPVADLPASDLVRVQDLTPFALDNEQLGLSSNEFTEADRHKLDALAVASSVLVTNAQIDSENDPALRGFSVELVRRLIERFITHPTANDANMPLVAVGAHEVDYRVLQAAGIHTQSPGSINATDLDDRRVPITSAGGWTTVPYRRGSHQIMEGNGAGLSVTNSSGDVRGNFQQFTPGYPLTGENATGIILLEATVSLNTRSNNNILLADGSISQRKSSFVFTASLIGTTAYSRTSSQGSLMNTWVVRQGNTTLGELGLYLAHSNNNAGFYLVYTGESGSASWAFSERLEVASIS